MAHDNFFGDELDWAALYEAAVGVPPRELEQAALSVDMATAAISRQAAAAVRPKAAPPKAKAAAPAAAGAKVTAEVSGAGASW